MKFSKSIAGLFSIVLLAVIAWPIRENWRAKPKDDFPLSYYPMFSHKREPNHSLPYFVGYDVANNRYPISYQYCGNGGFNQVRRQINKKVRRGEHDKLTQKVAKRLGRCKEAPYNQLVRVELVTGTYHLESYFTTGNKAPLTEETLSSQRIARQ